MSEKIAEVSDAPSAIQRAFEFFESFMGRENLSNPLLEGVKFDDPNWLVKIGYDVGETRQSLGAFGGERINPRRMVRTFVIGPDGSLVEMT